MNPASPLISSNVYGSPNVQGRDGNIGPSQMEAVGVEFEGVFLSLMLKEMRNSLDEGGFFGEESSDTYGGMFDLFIGRHLAEAKPLGVADMLLEQYSKVAAAAGQQQADASSSGTSVSA